MAEPGRVKRWLTQLGGVKLEEASRDQLDRAGIGIRPHRPGTAEIHNQDLRASKAQLEAAREQARLAAERRAALVRNGIATFVALSAVAIILYAWTH